MNKKKLIVNIDTCYACGRCSATCDYYYHPRNEGYVRCLALGVQEHVCRRCENPPCVAACPREALEKDAGGMLHRSSLRCTSCKSCTVACPFGVISPQIVEYATSMCDYCADRCDDAHVPVCVSTCPHGALSWQEAVEDPAADTYAVRGGVYYVRTVKWKK